MLYDKSNPLNCLNARTDIMSSPVPLMHADQLCQDNKRQPLSDSAHVTCQRLPPPVSFKQPGDSAASAIHSTMSIAAATTEHGEESTAALPLHSTAPPPHFTLYTYWRSSCTWRVRIALNYKQLTYTPQYINLLKGEHKSEEYGRVNPAHALPTLAVSYAETQQQLVLGESLAIMEWLEETHPTPPLLPTEPSQSNEQPTSQPAVHSKAVHQRSQSNASRRGELTGWRAVLTDRIWLA